MISYIVLVLCMVVILFLYSRNKTTLGALLTYFLISPYIDVGNAKIDGMYLAVIVFWVAVIVKEQFSIRPHRLQGLLQYFGMLLLVYALFFVAWLVFNRNNGDELLTIYFGVAKTILFMQVCYEMNQTLPSRAIQRQMFVVLTMVIVTNFVCCILQLTNVELGLKLILKLQDTGSFSYALANTKWGHFSRCFGIMSYPMQLGIFCLFAHALLLSLGDVLERKWNVVRIILLLLNIFCGFCSASKTFVIGLAVLLAFQLIFQMYFENVNRKSVVIVSVISICMLICVIFYDQIYDLLYQALGPNYARYWSFLAKPAEIFSSRYSLDAEYLSYMPEFLREYGLFGVGVVSIADERVIDSAPLVILHNGGIVALIIVVSYYVFHFIKSFARKDYLVVSIILVIMITGSGFQTWIAADASTWVLMYIFMLDEEKQGASSVVSRNAGVNYE